MDTESTMTIEQLDRAVTEATDKFIADMTTAAETYCAVFKALKPRARGLPLHLVAAVVGAQQKRLEVGLETAMIKAAEGL